MQSLLCKFVTLNYRLHELSLVVVYHYSSRCSMVTPLCTVVVWQPPANPNGVIQGNDIKFSSGGAITLSASLNFHVTPEAQRTANPPVQVYYTMGY